MFFFFGWLFIYYIKCVYKNVIDVCDINSNSNLKYVFIKMLLYCYGIWIENFIKY